MNIERESGRENEGRAALATEGHIYSEKPENALHLVKIISGGQS